MKLLLYVIALLAAAIAAALFALDDPGYVLIARAPWSLELPLSLFLVLLLLGVVALFAAAWLILRTWAIPRQLRRWRQSRHHGKARKSLNEGLMRLAEGNWAEAEARLLARLRLSETPVINYLGAAYAAAQRGDHDKRDEYLSRAHQSAPQFGLAIGLTQARLQALGEQYERALATLEELRRRHPRHNDVLKQLAAVYRALEDWDHLAELLPLLHKRRVLDEKALNVLELETHGKRLALAARSAPLDAVRRLWAARPRTLAHHPELVKVYVRRLFREKEMEEAERVLREAIQAEWREDLVALYGCARTSNPAAQLRIARDWLQRHANDAIALLTVARLEAAAEHWNEAQTHLEKSLSLHPSPEAYYELGHILDQQGHTVRAKDAYRRGLECAREDTGNAMVAPN